MRSSQPAPLLNFGVRPQIQDRELLRGERPAVAGRVEPVATPDRIGVWVFSDLKLPGLPRLVSLSFCPWVMAYGRGPSLGGGGGADPRQRHRGDAGLRIARRADVVPGGAAVR